MKKTKPKPAKTKKTHASFSRVELCKICSTDARTIDRRCQVMGISSEPRTGPTDPVMFKLTSKQVEQLKQPLPRGAFQNGLGSTDLRRDKLAEEVEFLRLKNKKLREASTPNRLFAKFLQDASHTIPDLVAERLETYAIDGGNKEPAELRAIGRTANDDIRAGVFSFLGTWIPRFEQPED